MALAGRASYGSSGSDEDTVSDQTKTKKGKKKKEKKGKREAEPPKKPKTSLPSAAALLSGASKPSFLAKQEQELKKEQLMEKLSSLHGQHADSQPVHTDG